MSRHAILVIRFPDNKKMYGLYYETLNTSFNQLFLRENDAWDFYYAQQYDPEPKCTCDHAEDVYILCMHLSAQHWTGVACRTCRVLIKGHDMPDNAGADWPEWMAGQPSVMD